MDDFWNIFFLLQLEKLIWQRKRIRAELELENNIHNKSIQNEFSPYSMDFENLEFEENSEEITDESENNSQKSSSMRIYKKSELMPKYNNSVTIQASFSNNEIVLNKIRIAPRNLNKNTNPKKTYRNRLDEMCEVCGIIIRRKNMDYHMNTHLNRKPFVCNYKNCRKSFASRSTLYNHKRLHTTTKNFECDICSATFHFNGNLQKHKATHFEAKFKCSICCRKFRTKHSLTYHMFSHNEPEEVTCKFPSCNRKFKNTYGASEHLRRFHKIKVKERVARPST